MDRKKLIILNIGILFIYLLFIYGPLIEYLHWLYFCVTLITSEGLVLTNYTKTAISLILTHYLYFPDYKAAQSSCT